MSPISGTELATLLPLPLSAECTAVPVIDRPWGFTHYHSLMAMHCKKEGKQGRRRRRRRRRGSSWRRRTDWSESMWHFCRWRCCCGYAALAIVVAPVAYQFYASLLATHVSVCSSAQLLLLLSPTHLCHCCMTLHHHHWHWHSHLLTVHLATSVSGLVWSVRFDGRCIKCQSVSQSVCVVVVVVSLWLVSVGVGQHTHFFLSPSFLHWPGLCCNGSDGNAFLPSPSL